MNFILPGFIFTNNLFIMNTELIALLANLALSLSFVVGLIFGIVQVRVAARDRRERLTLETLHNFQTREFAELIHYVTSHKNIPAHTHQLRALPAHEQTIFIQLAQQMESLGLLVAEKFINLNLVDKTLGSFVSTAWEKYKPLIVEMRSTQSDPFLAEYFQWLAQRIDERMEMNPRKPFHETA